MHTLFGRRHASALDETNLPPAFGETIPVPQTLTRPNALFAERCRKGLDIGLGRLRAESYPDDLNPLAAAITTETRTIIREILDVRENTDAELRKALTSVKPLTFRRRILNWFEHG